MKIRQGFVTNSSSTSYILMFKGKKENLSDELFKQMGVSIGSPFIGLVTELIKHICNGDALDISDYEFDEKLSSKVKILEDKGWKFIEVRVSNEDESPIMQWAYNEEGKLIIDTETLKLLDVGRFIGKVSKNEIP